MNDNNWYKAQYINQIELAVSLYPQLSLDSEQFLVVLTVIWLQKSREMITVDSLCKHTKLKKERINEIIVILKQKNYLDIKTKKNGVEFDLDGMFMEEVDNLNILDGNLFNLFEQEFGRVLTQNELQILIDLKRRYSQEDITEALRKTLIYEKSNMNYVAKILSNMGKESKDE